MAKIDRFDILYDFLDTNKKLIECTYVTHIDVVGFNEMVGNECIVYIKIKTVKGYKNKLIQWYTNDTYLCDYEGEIYDDKIELINEHLNCMNF